MIRADLVLALALAGTTPAIAQAAPESPARLTRTDDPDAPLLRGDARIGEITVSYYDRMQRRHGDAYPHMDDQFVCRSGTAQILRGVARAQVKGRDAATRTLIRQGNQAAIQALVIDVIGELDAVTSAAIRADEAIGPGVYHPSITAIAYTIRRCRFF